MAAAEGSGAANWFDERVVEDLGEDMAVRLVFFLL